MKKIVLLCLIGENGGRNGAGRLEAVVVFAREEDARFCYYCFSDLFFKKVYFLIKNKKIFIFYCFN